MEGSTKELGSSQSEERSCSEMNKVYVWFWGQCFNIGKRTPKEETTVQQKQSISSEEITIQRWQDEISKDGAVCEVINVTDKHSLQKYMYIIIQRK